MDDEMGKVRWLEQRKTNGVWYIRVPVPKHLIPLAGTRAKRKSLETKDQKAALKAYRKALGEIEGEFERLEARLAGSTRIERVRLTGDLDALTKADLEELVRQWWERREAARSFDDSFLPTSQEISDLREIDRQSTPDSVARMVDRLLVEAGVRSAPVKMGKFTTSVEYPLVDRSSQIYRRLIDIVDRGLRIEEQLLLDEAEGKRRAAYDPLFNPSGDKMGQAGSSAPKTLEHLIAAFQAERELQHGKESTERKYDLLFRTLREVWGPDMAVRDIDRAKVIAIRKTLEALPPNSMKRFPKLSVLKAVEHARGTNLAGLAPNTVNSYLQNLLAMLRWAEGQNWGVKLYLRDLAPARRANVKRRGFTPDELTLLFDALHSFKETNPTKFWVPALALYSGARAGELCQLQKADVRGVEEIPFIDFSVFNPDTGLRVDDKNLKTDASERQLPLHSELLASGFLEFVENTDTDRLFPDLLPGSKDDYAHNFSKWFGRFKKGVGLHQPSLVFHSFRHGFRDACREVGISEDLAMALGGWATRNVASGYGSKGARRIPA
ncbi:site-specific integrase [Croceicoccus mobilis]|nr:site-specific integrase [Croceicoccus mobilis]